jgi:hypothetical protein
MEQAKQVRSEGQYEEWKLTKSRWTSFTEEVLLLIYRTPEQAKEFTQCFVHMIYSISEWQQYLQDDYKDVGGSVNVLMSLQERLELVSEPSGLPRTTEPEPAATTESTGKPVIFLVHGRDQGKREEVARFLEKSGDYKYDVVILDEQATGGLTLIEKFEQHAANAKYAVVLVTGDDVGGLKGGELQPRARQNVVFELGFFFSKLTRHKVAVLYEADVEKPTDVDGVGYISLGGDWRRVLFEN